jgi:hypothetical protein
MFDGELKPEVMLLVERFYVDLRPRRITWQLEDADEVSIDGATVIWIERDSYRLDRSLGYQVVERRLETGGSRRYPHISGRLVIDVALRDEAVIEPEPERVEEIDAVRTPDPAAHLDDETLVAELERRGYRVEETVAAISIVQKIARAYERRDAELWEEAVKAAVEIVERSDDDDEREN